MIKDDRVTIELLKAELGFFEKGGYGRSVRTPWQPTSIFQDSPSCLNLGDPARMHPCSECLLIDFVPPESRDKVVPCHYISLDASAATIHELELNGNQSETEDAVKGWLHTTIDQLAGRRNRIDG